MIVVAATVGTFMVLALVLAGCHKITRGRFPSWW